MKDEGRSARRQDRGVYAGVTAKTMHREMILHRNNYALWHVKWLGAIGDKATRGHNNDIA